MAGHCNGYLQQYSFSNEAAVFSTKLFARNFVLNLLPILKKFSLNPESLEFDYRDFFEKRIRPNK